MKPPRLYLIPGLGADGRLFEGLRRAGLEFEVIEFVTPLQDESFEAYALRLAAAIDQTQPFVLGGMSLGGMLATEIAFALKLEKLILISTCKSSREFPPYFKVFRYLPVHKLISGKQLKRHAPRSDRSSMAPWQNDILEQMRIDSDPILVKWAVSRVIHWRSKPLPKNLLHLHGTEDKLFPLRFVGEAVHVQGGSHVMVMDRAAEVVAEIQRFLEAPYQSRV
jgi:pimeloyl-ACP methyl ester carboxylesterase